jgi:hypothetical protein
MSARRHTLYVPPGSDAVAVKRTLNYVASVTGVLRARHGVEIEVYRVRACDMQNSRVLAAFKAKGAASLPALFAGRGRRPLVGAQAIRAHYESVLGPRESPQRESPSYESQRDDAPSEQFQDGDGDGDGDQAASDLHEYLSRELRGGGGGGEDSLDDA